MKVSALVPIKLHSVRLKNKNFLIVKGKPLLVNIFKTLSKIKELDSVFCYSSEEKIMKLLPRNIKYLKRPKYLDKNNVKANELFRYGIERIESEIIIICHATSPFISSSSIIKGIKSLKTGKFRSSFSVKPINKYSWYKMKPINYNPKNMKKTQNLDPIYSETGGFYAFFKNDYLKSNTRINKKIKFIEVTEKESIDIDTRNDLEIARIFSEKKI